MTDAPGPVLGPCEAWIDGADVASCCGCDPSEDPAGTAVFDTVALEASMALFEISGQRFPGDCSRTVRPCRDACSCWASPALGLSYLWTTVPYGWGGWGWRNEGGDRCGCGSLSTVRLSGYPVREITEVKIDGVVLDALDTNGNPNYRLDGWRDLVRMDDPGPPVVARRWPACQNLALDDDQLGTFSVSYTWGETVPQLGRDAAVELAVQLYNACSGAECSLPAGATRIVRSGVEIDRGLLANWFNPNEATGLVHLDAFLAAYWSTRARSRPAVFSPDVQQFARRLGSS